MITREDIKRFAPKAKPAYVDALMAGMETLRDAGILDSAYRIAHFMAQVGHETGGFTIIRESMAYKPQRLREVWPSRFRNKPTAELKALCADPVKLADAVYGGRMGNRKGTSDGYDFRGAGFLQTTGRAAVELYARKLGIEVGPHILDDLGILLKFACLEWKESQCCTWADENDIVKVSKAINTGSATSNVRPVNLDDRKEWFARAWSIWGERGTPDKFDETVEASTLVSVGKPALKGGTGTLIANYLMGDPVGVTSSAVALKGNTSQLLAGVDLTTWGVPALILLAAGGLIFYLRRTA